MTNNCNQFHVGFADIIVNENRDKEEVYRVCGSSTGKCVAYAKSKEMAEMVAIGLNHINRLPEDPK